MTRSSARLSAFGRLLAAAAVPLLLLPLLLQPLPSLAADDKTIQNSETTEAASTNSNEVTMFSLQQSSVIDGRLTSTATDQENTVTLQASAATMTQSQSDVFISESTISNITVEQEPTTNTAAPAATYTWELSSDAATAVEITTEYTTHGDAEVSADGETSLAPQLSTSDATESSTAEITWTTTPKAEETVVSLGVTDDFDKTTLTAAVSADSQSPDDQTDRQTSTEPVGTTWSEHTHIQTTAVSNEAVHTSTESRVTTEAASTHTETLTRAASDSQSSAGLTIPGDSNETQHSTTAQSIASQELPISTSKSVITTDSPQRRRIHAVATYGIDYQNLTAANLTEVFEESFTTALTLLLKIDRADIIIMMVVQGSTIVHFEVSVPSDGVEQAASALKNKTDELHTAFISSVKNDSAILTELLQTAGKPYIAVHIMRESSSATSSGAALTTAATKTSDAPATSNSLTDGEIAGVVIGSVLGALLLVAIVACICKKRSPRSKLDEISTGGFKARSIANHEMVTGPGA